MLDVVDILVVVASLVNAYLALLKRILQRRQHLSATICSDRGATAAAAMQLLLVDCWSHRYSRGGRFCRAYCFRPCRAKPDMTISAE